MMLLRSPLFSLAALCALGGCATTPSDVITSGHRDHVAITGTSNIVVPCFVRELDDVFPALTVLARPAAQEQPIRVLLKGNEDQGTIAVIDFSQVGDHLTADLYAKSAIVTPGTFFERLRAALSRCSS